MNDQPSASDRPAAVGDRSRGSSAAAKGSSLAGVAADSGIGHWTLDRRSRRMHWSPELRDLHGLAEHDPLPHPAVWLRDFVHPDDQGATRRLLAGWRSAGTPSIRHGLRVRRPDGTLRELLTHTLIGIDDNPQLAVGVVIDVTPLRLTEQALLQAEGRVALTANAVGLGTWDVDLRSGAVRWDDAMWQLRGLAPRAQALDYEQRLNLVHPDDRERVRLVNSQALSANYEFRIQWPDGQVRWLAARSTTLRDGQGWPLRRLGINWDVTAQREAEAAAREREAALLEGQTRARTLARMSHDLRTPLNAIIGCTQLLQGGESADPVRLAQRLAEIQAAGLELLGLVDRVLDLTTALDPSPVAQVVAQPPASPPAPAPEPSPQADRAAASGTVLYIEDNNVNAMIVRALVERRADLSIVIAENGHEGLARAAELQPGLVLLDMQLPDLDGAEVFRRLRANPGTAALPCIALSANAMPEDIRAALAAGMTDYWTKPLDFQRFAQSLDRIFGPAPPR